MTRSRTQNKKLQVQQALIDRRRSQVIQLVHMGKTLNEIAEILQVDRSTVSRDYQLIRDNAAAVLSEYMVETIPMEVMKFLARLNAVSDEAWRMVERADKEGDNKAKIRALYLAQDTALQIVNAITNNKALIDEVFKSQQTTERHQQKDGSKMVVF